MKTVLQFGLASLKWKSKYISMAGGTLLLAGLSVFYILSGGQEQTNRKGAVEPESNSHKPASRLGKFRRDEVRLGASYTLDGQDFRECKKWDLGKFLSILQTLSSRKVDSVDRHKEVSAFEYLATKRPDLFLNASNNQLLVLQYSPGALEGIVSAYRSIEATAGGAAELQKKNPVLCWLMLSSAQYSDEFVIDRYMSLSDLASVMPTNEGNLKILMRCLDSFNERPYDQSVQEELSDVSRISTRAGRLVVEAKMLELNPLENQDIIQIERNDPESKDLLFESFIKGVMREDPRSGMIMATQLEGNDRKLLMKRLLKEWLQSDPMEASKCAIEIYPKEEHREVAAIVVEYLKSKGDLAAAEQWSAMLNN